MEDCYYPLPASPELISEDYQNLLKRIDTLHGLGIFKLAITGTENVLPTGPKIDAYSHYTEWGDAIMAGYPEYLTTGLPERFMTKDNYYQKQIKLGAKVISLAEKFQALDGFPISQNSLDLHSIEHASELLSLGHRVAIAAQGESVYNSAARPKLKKGLGVIAILGGAPIQPKAIVGKTWRVPFAGKKFFENSKRLPTIAIPRLSFTRSFVVRYGEAIEPPKGAEEFKLDQLEKVYNPQTQRDEVILPKGLFRLASKFHRTWAPAFYKNYTDGLLDYEEIYGRPA